jgi:hypothetical protein
MKQVEIYIHECVKRLPDNLKKDIQKELTVEISEMIQQKIEEGVSQEKAIQVVLEQLGDPIELANQYNDKKSYLIGPTYYNTYSKILRIVMASVFVGVSIAFGLSLLLNDISLGSGLIIDSIIDVIIDYIAIIFNVGLQIFVWITVVFALIERNEKSLLNNNVNEDKWTIKELPKNIANNKTSKLEGIISVVVYSVFLILINVKINVFQIIYISKNNINQLVSLFNEADKSNWLVGLSTVLVLLIGIHLIQLASSSMSKKKELVILGMRIVALGLFLWVIGTTTLYNPELPETIAPNNLEFASWVNSVYVVTLSVLVSVNIASISRKAYRLLKL